VGANQITLLTKLLNRTGEAHGAYEGSVLHGVYDEMWYIWYAQWAVDHGFNEIVSKPVTPQELSVLLRDLNVQHREHENEKSWAEFTAERLALLLS
jgi:hypothetical protein